jgi:hypothetical protein
MLQVEWENRRQASAEAETDREGRERPTVTELCFAFGLIPCNLKVLTGVKGSSVYPVRTSFFFRPKRIRRTSKAPRYPPGQGGKGPVSLEPFQRGLLEQMEVDHCKKGLMR